MDCEIYDIVYNMMKGIVVDDETLALETVHNVGPHGNFLAQKHTRKHMRELWAPKYMDRRSYESWQENGDNPPDWASAMAGKIYANHQPEPLDLKISQEMSNIISAVEKG